jgi:hypothetical protein
MHRKLTFRSKVIIGIRTFLSYIYKIKLYKYKELDALIKDFAKSRSLAIDISDAIALYEYIINRKPNYILEFGPGTSSNIICLAILNQKKKDPNYNPIFISLEHHKDWLDFHHQTFKKELAPYCQMILVPTILSAFNGEGACKYAEIPDYPYDFIFVDGPSPSEQGVLISTDCIELADKLSPTCTIVFDGREASAKATYSLLKEKGFKKRRHPFSICWELSRIN